MIPSSTHIDPGPDPTPQTGTSLSQPLQNEAQKLLSRFQRTISERAQNELHTSTLARGQIPEREYVTLDELRRSVFRVILERLRARNVSLTLMKMQTFWWCLPTRYAVLLISCVF
jgi:hypothetical protein